MRLTWWGHASATVETSGVRVLTDPVFTSRLAHLRRIVPPPPASARLADIVLISHLHADHLHLPSLRRLAAGTRVVVPRGAEQLVHRAVPAVDVEAVGPGEAVRAGGVTITATAARHDGRRLPGSPHRGPALGYVLDDGSQHAWFAGDTGLFAGMADIGPVDVALVPVGGWGPTLGPEHLDPAQAAEAVARVGAHDAVPVHYATFWPAGLRALAPGLFERKCREPGARFADALSGARAHVLAPGGSVDIT